MTDILIDTDDYEHQFGKRLGRGFWRFRIVSTDPAVRDHIFTMVNWPFLMKFK